MGVIESLVELACDDMNPHFAAFLVGRSVSLDDFGPEHAACAELGKLHEIVGGYTHVEFNAGGNLVDGQAGLGHHCEPFGTPCKRVSELLGDVSTGIVEQIRVNCETLDSLDLLHGLIDLAALFSCIFVKGKAVTEQTAERIVVDSSAEFILGACLLDELHQLSGDFRSHSGAAGDIYLNLLQVDALQDVTQIGCGEIAQTDSERLDSAVDDVKGVTVCLRGILADHSLTDNPVVVAAGAAHVGELSGKSAYSGQSCEIFSAIERLNVESFVGAPHQLAIEVGALEVDIDFRLPLFSGDRREHVKQFFLIF